MKNRLIFNSTLSLRLVRWNQSTDCCTWSGVDCDMAGHVIGLDLSEESIYGGIDNSTGLFALQHLRSLNLASNLFDEAQIPSRLANLTNLTYLNLSDAGFVGQIPIEISSLTRLVTLDLSCYWSPCLQPNLKVLVQNFSELKQLYLDGVYISAHGNEWGQALSSSLPNLQVLSLSNCHLSGPIPSSLADLQSLSIIRLDDNDLYGKLPENMFKVSTLVTLDLSFNNLLHGSLPNFPQNNSLRTLVLRNTNLSGTLPDSIGNLKSLSKLDLVGCNFTGPLPMSMGNLTQLEYVDLSSNHFIGPLPPSMGNLTQLEYVDLSSNNFTTLPTSVGYLTRLQYVDLSYNNFTCTLPTSVGYLTRLQHVDLSSNKFSGPLPTSMGYLTRLEHLYLSSNNFSGSIPSFHKSKSLNYLGLSQNVSSSVLETLDLSGNRLEGPIPMSIFELKNLRLVDLSSNKLNGTVQLDVIGRLDNLIYFDLSYNNLTVNVNTSFSSFPPNIWQLKLASCKLSMIPNLKKFSYIRALDLSDNQISGEIPNWIWEVSGTDRNLSHNSLVGFQEPYSIDSNLVVLDLHSNLLQGKIPFPDDIGNSPCMMSFFSVANNKLTGVIPESLCNATMLEVLDLSSNNLSGRIPTCLIEEGENLGVLNVRRNSLYGTIPDRFPGKFPGNCGLKMLTMNGNQLEGLLPKSLANCTKLEVLDLGNNKMSDAFPCWLKKVSSLHVLVLRSNKFYGNISCLEYDVSWPMLQIFDLASNNFTGRLPQKGLTTWEAMMVDEHKAQSQLKQLQFEMDLFPEIPQYKDSVTVTTKDCDMADRVIGLDLSEESIYGGIDNSTGLFSLRHLRRLNLAYNLFDEAQIPSRLANLTNLTYLNLSKAGFVGQIPIEISSLTRLVTLDLSRYWSPCLQPNLKVLVQNFSELRQLYLDGVYISAHGNEWGQALSSSLPNLQVLSLVYCNLKGKLPENIFKVSTLETLDLSSNDLHHDSFLDFPQNNSLRTLVLHNTSLSGTLPHSIGNLKSLSKLDLGRCNFSGPLPTSMANLTQVEHLDLSSNNFTGLIPSLNMSKSLNYLDLSDNQFEGQIPEFLNASSSVLKHLDLSVNRLEGPIPMSIFELKNLQFLILSSNKFNGTVQLDVIGRLGNLSWLDLSYNNLAVNVSTSFSSFPQRIFLLKLASCKLVMFPNLKNCSLLELDLSNNLISGEIPNWIWEVGFHLNLSHNSLVGFQEPYSILNLVVLDLHSNRLQGKIPLPPPRAAFVDYSSNNFTSSIPDDIGNVASNMDLFSVSNNKLTGVIPESLCIAKSSSSRFVKQQFERQNTNLFISDW
ncbi:hypothetical protein LWI28_015009 [Acer negundo]|uniref:Leucine-rich repeat-containing N-terminal plant-type domain-containing protein n=1 Tax=Acer negundo TaxID=4023 RepID=A0AAD5I6X4_ACENE|nr:hypothetical protein LWI28_015009 [Acer negundo]